MTVPQGDVLVSFLGRAPRGRGYQTATYVFGDDRTESARFFGCAAVRHLVKTGRPLRRWVVLGTAGSDWASISEGAENQASTDEEAILKALERLEAPSQSDSITDDDLKPLESLIADANDIEEVRLRVIPYGQTDEEATAIAATLAETVFGTARIHLDITHGFRHLPAIAMVTTFGLRWSHGLELGHLLYAAQAAPRIDGMTTVVDLAACQEMAGDTAALATFRTTGHYAALARTVTAETGALIETAAFRESVNRTGEARTPAREARRAVKELQDPSPLRQASHQALDEALAWSDGARFLDRLRERATSALDREDWIGAATTCYECLHLAAARCGGRPNVDPNQWSEDDRDHTRTWIQNNFSRTDKDDFHRLRKIRNAIVHGTRPTGPGAGDVDSAMKDPKGLSAAIHRGIELLDSLIASSASSLGKITP